MNKLTLHPDDGGQPIEIEVPHVRIGRDVAADLCLQDPSVSRHHAEIENRGDGWFIFDLNSSNGIRIEGILVPEAKLTYGAALRIGQVGFRVEIEGEGSNPTIVLDRPPDFDRGAEKTMLTPPPLPARRRPAAQAPGPPPRRHAPRSSDSLGALTAVLVTIALALAALEAYQTFGNQVPPAQMATGAQGNAPLPATVVPSVSPVAAPAGLSQATILVSTDGAATVSIDGQKGTKIAASSLKRFKVEPGDHVVRFSGAGWQAEVVVRVLPGEQKLVRPSDDPSAVESGVPEAASPQ